MKTGSIYRIFLSLRQLIKKCYHHHMKKSAYDYNKVAIVGTGKVGLTGAYALLLKGIADEIVLVGRDKAKIIGEKLDFEHGMTFLQPTRILATDDYADLVDSDVVVVTAGAAQKPGETRLDLAQNNLAIIESIIPKVVAAAPRAIIIIVSNPCDVLTYRAYQVANLPKGQIFGSGTCLDTARFRFHLGEMLHINSRSVHAYIIGEHGDSSFPLITSANIGGQKLSEFKNINNDRIQAAYLAARDAAYKIINAKGATFYAIGTVIAKLVETVLRDGKTVLPVSVPLHNYYGHSGVALSVPCVVGRNGIEEILRPDFSLGEEKMFARSVEAVKEYL